MTVDVLLTFAALLVAGGVVWCALWALGGALAWWAGEDDHD